MKKAKAKKYKLKSGCFMRWLPMILTTFFVVILTVVFLSRMHFDWSELKKYSTLLEELSQEVSESDMTETPITDIDRQNFYDKMNGFLKNNEDLSLFDEKGNFVYDNIKPENVTFLQNSLTLDKRDFACFINSVLGAGLVDELYNEIDKESLLNVLDMSVLETDEQTSHITAICKIDFSVFSDELGADDREAQQILDDLNDIYYFVYDVTLLNKTVQTSSMQVNKLSKESNDLLMELLFEDFKDENQNHIVENLNSIMKFVLDQLDQMGEMWNLDYEFNENELVFTQK